MIRPELQGFAADDYVLIFANTVIAMSKLRDLRATVNFDKSVLILTQNSFAHTLDAKECMIIREIANWYKAKLTKSTAAKERAFKAAVAKRKAERKALKEAYKIQARRALRERKALKVRKAIQVGKARKASEALDVFDSRMGKNPGNLPHIIRLIARLAQK